MVNIYNRMTNMITNVYVKFSCDRLRIDKASGNFRNSDNSKSRNKVCSA